MRGILGDLPELRNLRQPSIHLIAHGRHNIIDGYHTLLIDESFAPDLGVDLVARLKMLADVILLLSDT